MTTLEKIQAIRDGQDMAITAMEAAVMIAHRVRAALADEGDDEPDADAMKAALCDVLDIVDRVHEPDA